MLKLTNLIQAQRLQSLRKSYQAKLIKGLAHNLHQPMAAVCVEVSTAITRHAYRPIQQMLLNTATSANRQAEKIIVTFLKKVLYYLYQAQSDLRRDRKKQWVSTRPKDRQRRVHF